MQKGRFITGFVLGALLCGTAVVFSAIGNYTPKPDGDWIRDVTKYVPGTDDQINVLADIQPGGGVLMMEVGLRVNALYFAGKKKNWDLAAYEMHELTEALEKLEITRPAMAGFLGSFLAGPEVASVNAAIAAQDKSAFKTAIRDMTNACMSCHTNFGKPFLVIKLGKSALPLK